MSERTGFEVGVPCWIDTAQPDVDAATRFYASLFSWDFVGPGDMPGEPAGKYFVAQMRARDVAGVSSMPPQAPSRPVWNTYIQVANVDDSAHKAQQEGAKVLAEPLDVDPAGRMAVLADRQGAVFSMWEPRQRRGAQIVNEAGAWSMSVLSTDDARDAASFYGAVFGWSTETFGQGDSAATMYRLAGYVGGEPQQPVARDVVAVMVNAVDGQAPRWDVNFWVSDADETAAKAAALGGEVVVPPFDTPISRDAVVADPQGAVFSVSTVPANLPS